MMPDEKTARDRLEQLEEALRNILDRCTHWTDDPDAAYEYGIPSSEDALEIIGRIARDALEEQYTADQKPRGDDESDHDGWPDDRAIAHIEQVRDYEETELRRHM